MDAPNTVIITTSGRGSRMGALTEHTNKSLLPVAGKAVLSHIFDNYAPDTHFFVCVAYKGSLVCEYIALAHPDLHVTFVYEQEPVSLGRTLLEARKIIGDDRPFIFHAGDTLVCDEIITHPGCNTVYTSATERTGEYRTIGVSPNFHTVCAIYDKEYTGTYSATYIGLIAIQDASAFWHCLTYSDGKPDASDAHAVQHMLAAWCYFEVKYVSWLDTGTPEALVNAEDHFVSSTTVLPKADQITYFVGDKVIKFFADSKIVGKRYRRAYNLKDVVPECQVSTHFYRYTYAPGELARDVLQPKDLGAFLDWCQRELWVTCPTVDGPKFAKECFEFYHVKTAMRIKQYAAQQNFTPSMLQLALAQLSPIPAAFWSEGIPTTKMHGDLHFSNIVVTPLDGEAVKYSLIDWREDFAGNVNIGDVYYDLAKLLHGMIVSHDLVHHMTHGIHMRHQRHVECEREFEIWCDENGYDWQRVRALCGLVFINIAPLHHSGYDRFLWEIGWKMLSEVYE